MGTGREGSSGAKEGVHIEHGLHEKNILREDFPFRLIVDSDDSYIWPTHWHDAVEIIYVTKGSFGVLVHNQDIRLSERDILFIPGGRLHGFDLPHVTGERILINFDFSPLYPYPCIRRVHDSLQEVILLRESRHLELHRLAERRLQRIIRDAGEKKTAYELSVMAEMLQLFVILRRHAAGRMLPAVREITDEKETGLVKIHRAFEFIEKRFREDITLRDVARATGFSESYFSRIFKEITEENFRQYLMEFRLKKAEQLLMDMDNTVSMAARSAGFGSIATFERLFKRWNGCTPMEYRKMRAGNGGGSASSV